MGTRNLTIVAADGGYPVAQYGQFDGYPSGQGLTVLKFLRELKPEDRAAFKAKCLATGTYAEGELDAELKEKGIEHNDGWMDMAAAEKFAAAYPNLHRSTAALILPLIRDSPPGLKLRRDLEFIGDSLFCEWAYVVDLDTNKLEVYKGFNKDGIKPTDRFYNMPVDAHNPEYKPCVMIASFDLDSLPDDTAFIAACKANDED